MMISENRYSYLRYKYIFIADVLRDACHLDPLKLSDNNAPSRLISLINVKISGKPCWVLAAATC